MGVYRRFVIARSERGQIVIPALFFFPTLMLFVFLLFETAKLSRMKIRKQFAIDAAAFVEMTNYTDFLNRSAYVNGPFPMRIMNEGFAETRQNCRFRTPCPPPGELGSDELMWRDGAFPRDSRYVSSIPDSVRDWDIEYGGPRASLMNTDSPSMQTWDRNPTNPCTGQCGLVFTQDTAQHWNIGWEDATTIFKMYVQIYQLLGSVESAQFNVLKRLTSGSNHNFLSKSYWLNADQTNEALSEAGGAVRQFAIQASQFIPGVQFHCMPKMRVYANKFTNDIGVYGVAYEDYNMPSSIQDCSGSSGLFQLVTVKRNVIQSMSAGATGTSGSFGWPIEAVWSAPNNYFDVDLNAAMRGVDNGPKVHATVGVFTNGGRAAVWPRPNPKFQTRLYP